MSIYQGYGLYIISMNSGKCCKNAHLKQQCRRCYSGNYIGRKEKSTEQPDFGGKRVQAIISDYGAPEKTENYHL